MDANNCSICGSSFDGMGNNAQPVNDGRCCDICDCEVVLPGRLMRMGLTRENAQAVGQLDLKLRKEKCESKTIPKID